MLTRSVISANYMLLIYYHIRIHAIDNKYSRSLASTKPSPWSTGRVVRAQKAKWERFFAKRTRPRSPVATKGLVTNSPSCNRAKANVAQLVQLTTN